jgi:hypothetical protein
VIGDLDGSPLIVLALVLDLAQERGIVGQDENLRAQFAGLLDLIDGRRSGGAERRPGC